MADIRAASEEDRVKCRESIRPNLKKPKKYRACCIFTGE